MSALQKVLRGESEHCAELVSCKCKQAPKNMLKLCTLGAADSAGSTAQKLYENTHVALAGVT